MIRFCSFGSHGIWFGYAPLDRTGFDLAPLVLMGFDLALLDCLGLDLALSDRVGFNLTMLLWIAWDVCHTRFKIPRVQETTQMKQTQLKLL